MIQSFKCSYCDAVFKLSNLPDIYDMPTFYDATMCPYCDHIAYSIIKRGKTNV